ncbi:MAG: ABC transporter substrate-binding protein [Nakamurella sp.]
MALRRRPQLVAAGAAALLIATTVLTACGSSTSAAKDSTSSDSAAVTSASISSASISSASTDSGSATSAAPDSSSSTTACEAGKLATKAAGTLTIATDQPVYEPWFVDNKPESGKGFESAVAYAVADKLGYAKDKVTWVRAGFDAVVSPAPKNFDFDINEFSITPERSKVVDFSTGYYDVTQAIVTTVDSKIAGDTTIAELKGATLGAQLGTTSLAAINDVIKPTNKPAVFGTNDDAVKALQNGQIDGVVTDLPTAFYMSSAQLKNGKVLGQLPATGSSDVEQFGLLLEKGSSITTCVSAAVDALRKDGTLKDLATQWLDKAGAPELK